MSKIQIQLSDGRNINLDLYEDVAPITVKNFKKLIKENFFDGLCFHRTIKDFMIQGGGFVADGRAIKEKGGADTIKGEFLSNGVKNDLHHGEGVISMARTNVKDSASSQFFICSADCAFLDGQYAAFGKTSDEESLAVVKSISKVPTHSFMYFDERMYVNVSNISIEQTKSQQRQSQEARGQ